MRVFVACGVAGALLGVAGALVERWRRRRQLRKARLHLHRPRAIIVLSKEDEDRAQAILRDIDDFLVEEAVRSARAKEGMSR